MNILIIGSEGFIGTNLIELAQNRFSVFGVDLFEQTHNSRIQYLKVSRLSPEWDEIFSSTKFEVCINAAGSGNVPYSVTHPVIDFEANALDVIRILDAIRKYQPSCRYIHISSAAVYGNPVKLPIAEDQVLNPVSPYGFHKLISETLCREYSSLFQLDIIIVRPFSVYGVGLKKQFFWDVCKNIQRSKDGVVSIIGTGEESRDYINVLDLVAAIFVIIDKAEMGFNIFNLATGKEFRISEVAKIIEKIRPSIRFQFSKTRRVGDPLNWEADISKVSNLGFKPMIPLEEGVRHYMNWFIALNE